MTAGAGTEATPAPPAALRLIPPAAHRRTRWRNGGGWTTEIARSDAGEAASEADFRWRVSVADIERDGPFSVFEGIDRELLLLDGAGLELDIDDAAPLRLAQRFAHARFRGEARVHCRLLAGPTRDLNVMVKRSELRAEVVVRPLVGAMVIFAQPGVEWLVHVLSGNARARSGSETAAAESGASFALDFRDPAHGRVLIDGAGELAFVKLVPADPDARDNADPRATA